MPEPAAVGAIKAVIIDAKSVRLKFEAKNIKKANRNLQSIQNKFYQQHKQESNNGIKRKKKNKLKMSREHK